MEKWIIKKPEIDIKNLSIKTGVSPLLCTILANRQITEPSLVIDFIHTPPKAEHEFLPKDMKKAVNIIIDAIAKKTKMRVIGDYDVDGVVSTYILTKGLRELGADVDFVIPHRVEDGYGVSEKFITKANEDGIKLIITCDNGITTFEPIRMANELNITTIITDHHQVSFEELENGEKISLLPEASAIVNSKQEDCPYPFKLLCGAGVAYKLIAKIYSELDKKIDLTWGFNELAAIATVCDVVDLVGDNRLLVKKGIKAIKETANIGLNTLIEVSGVSEKYLSTYHFGYIIGPSINAGGRLDYANLGVKLLMTSDNDVAKELAEKLFSLNQDRKILTLDGVERILEIVEEQKTYKDKVIVVYDSEIHESIAGIIAGRVKEKYCMPTIILTDGENCIKGSGRSIKEYNMHEELTKCKDLLLRFGGHPMAAGLSLEKKDFEELKNQLIKNCTLTDEDVSGKIYIDMELPLSDVSVATAEELEKLEPHGKGNEKPVFLDKDLFVRKMCLRGANKNVLSIALSKEQGGPLKYAVYFSNSQLDEIREKFDARNGKGSFLDIVENNKENIMKNNLPQIDLAYNIGINEFRGERNLQITVKSIK